MKSNVNDFKLPVHYSVFSYNDYLCGCVSRKKVSSYITIPL